MYIVLLTDTLLAIVDSSMPLNEEVAQNLHLAKSFVRESDANDYLTNQLTKFDDVYEFGAEYAIELGRVYHRSPKK